MSETPLDWLARIAPDEWETTESGYGLVLQSGDRRIVVDPLKQQASWDERVRTDEFGERWMRRELIEGRWYIQTTAGLLCWGVDGEATEGVKERDSPKREVR